MTKRKRDSIICISDSEEEYEPSNSKTKEKVSKIQTDVSRPLKKKRTPKKIIEKLDVDDESEEDKPKIKVPKVKVEKTTTRKRKKESADKMGGLLSKKPKTTAPGSPGKSLVTQNKQSIEGARAPPPVASSKWSVPQNAEVKSQSSGFKEYTITPTIHSPKDHDTPVYEWTEVDYIAEHHQLGKSVAVSISRLFKDDNTVPFIARYRRAVTGGLDADQLRLVKESYDRAQLIKHKANNVIKAIEKVGKWTPELHNSIKSIKSLNELEYVHSLYKTPKKTLAERAKELGLAVPADAILQGKPIPNLNSYINITKDGLKNQREIEEGIIHIIADRIVKEKQVFDKINELREKHYFHIVTKKIKSSESKDNKNENKENKYDMYYEWSSSEKNIKPHQILAINRAESQKVIKLELKLPEFFQSLLRSYIVKLYSAAAKSSDFHRKLLNQAFDHAYDKSIRPSIVRRARSEMKERAEEASMEVFATNVKQLLLTPPVRGKVILGIDPGFKHGCKLAVVSPQGDVLETATIYPHNKSPEEAGVTLRKLVKKHKCNVFALGNATACRETEVFLSGLIKSGAFSPLDVSYTIVDESGASIYSCNNEAKAEFPNLDYNVISAISIARRLQDPLAELVKIEPKHLGVGMYQHDLPEKQLMTKLNEVVMEAASFVGVDVNTASQCLLRRVAGLSETKAANIIEWRRLNGPFVNRDQLKEVKGIGAKTFEQCAGFIRIQPETAVSKLSSSGGNKKSGFNYLDQTWIHPESYSIAKLLIKDCGLDVKNIGTREFMSAIKVYATQDFGSLAKKLKTDETTLEIIIKGLSVARDYDIRAQNSGPLFRNSLRSIDDLKVGSLLSGEVRNVTHFGAFVDMGVGKDGLIHVSQFKGEILKIGQRVDVEVKSIVKEQGRIGLGLIKSY